MTAYSYDAVVIGATKAGLAWARYFADGGRRVAVLEWTDHIGGMTTGGLGKTDVVGQPGAARNTRWGRELQFFKTVGANPPYNLTDGSEVINFASDEAIVALNSTYLDTSFITVRTHQRIKRVVKDPVTNFLVSIVLENGDTYAAPLWVDGSYECDLAAFCGVRMSSGTDSNVKYNEKVQIPDSAGGASWPGLNVEYADAYAYRSIDAKGNRYPMRSLPPPRYAKDGSGYLRNQAYGFRHTVSNQSNRIAWSTLASPLAALGYRAADFAWVADMIVNNGGAGSPFPLGLSLYPVSGAVVGGTGRFTTNGGDTPGWLSNGWGKLSYSERDAMTMRAFYYCAGVMYFAATDASVPSDYRAALNLWGMPAEEFQTDYIGAPGWPSAYYVRQDRNIVGRKVLTTQNMYSDIAGAWFSTPKKLSCGGYTQDKHPPYFYPTPDGQTKGEGDYNYTGMKQYSIDQDHCTTDQVPNLFVIWGISASAGGMNSYRMEPTSALVGQAGGMLGGIAADMGVYDLSQIPYSALRVKLDAAGAVLSIPF